MRTAAMKIAKLDSGRRPNDDGQTLVEYALIIALISLAAIAALGFMSGKIQNVFSKSGNSLNAIQVSSGPPGVVAAPPPNGSGFPFPGIQPGSQGLLAGLANWRDAPMYRCATTGGFLGLQCTSWAGLALPLGGGVFGAGAGPCSFTLANGFTFSGSWQLPPGNVVQILYGFNTASNGSGTTFAAGCF